MGRALQSLRGALPGACRAPLPGNPSRIRNSWLHSAPRSTPCSCRSVPPSDTGSCSSQHLPRYAAKPHAALKAPRKATLVPRAQPRPSSRVYLCGTTWSGRACLGSQGTSRGINTQGGLARGQLLQHPNPHCPLRPAEDTAPLSPSKEGWHLG